MNRSYSKIRHVQESNTRLEKRLLGEQTEDLQDKLIEVLDESHLGYDYGWEPPVGIIAKLEQLRKDNDKLCNHKCDWTYLDEVIRDLKLRVPEGLLYYDD
jgi:hypothetical protein